MTRIEKHAERYRLARFFGATPDERICRMDRAVRAMRLRKERTVNYARRLGTA